MLGVRCDPTCGDGKKADVENCDDGSDNGIDCLLGCTGPSPGLNCTGNEPSVCFHICGDGLIRKAENCDDSDQSDNRGCKPGCLSGSLDGWSCDLSEPTLCDSICGDSLIIGDENCDDGTPNDG